MWKAHAHDGFVRGITIDRFGKYIFTCGDDKTIKMYPCYMNIDGTVQKLNQDPLPKMTWYSKSSFTGIDHSWQDDKFITCSRTVDVWNHMHDKPIQTFKWGIDTVTSVKYNPSDSNILSSTAYDRSICLYDIRSSTPVHKVILKMNTNCIAWNPMEPMNFTAANEDTNLYTFDMRKLDKASVVHKDHISAVISVSYSPNGQEFVSGSYDRTLRIFERWDGRSREVYHDRRMQKIFSVSFSADAQYVLSGSEDTDIRIWKSIASKSLGYHVGREKEKFAYLEKLKDRYKYMPEIRRIMKHRHVPKALITAKRRDIKHNEAEKRKFENRMKHSKKGTIMPIAERAKPIVKELD